MIIYSGLSFGDNQDIIWARISAFFGEAKNADYGAQIISWSPKDSTEVCNFIPD